MEERKGIRQGVKEEAIHLVRDGDGRVWLATKEGACWVGLFGELLLFVEDLGRPGDVVGDVARFRHLAKLVDQEAGRVAGLAQLARDLIKGRK